MSSPPHADGNTASAASVKPAPGKAPQPNATCPSLGSSEPGAAVSAAAAPVVPGADVGAGIPGAATPASAGAGAGAGAGAAPAPTPTITTNTNTSSVRVSNAAQSQELPMAQPAPGPGSQPTATRTNSPPPGPQHGTRSDNANNADLLSSQNKKPRPPALAQRQSGSSLLTLALATARGIPQSQPPLTSPTRTCAQQPPNEGRPNPPLRSAGTSTSARGGGQDPLASDPYNVPIREGHGGSLTPRASPRSVAMAVPASATTSAANVSLPEATLLPSPPYDAARTNSIDPILGDHRFLLGGALIRGKSLERLDREIRALQRQESGQGQPCGGPPFRDAMAPTTNQVRGRDGLVSIQSETNLEEGWNHARPKRPEHRFSMGAEKIWSIGSGEAGKNEGGQVEKSVTEALVKAEHSARSRKASHTLGFFKEGNPQQEMIKRRESKRGPREKTSTALEHMEEAGREAARDDVERRLDSKQSQRSETGVGDLARTAPQSNMLPPPPFKDVPLPSGRLEEGGDSVGETVAGHGQGQLQRQRQRLISADLGGGGASTAEKRPSDGGPTTGGQEAAAGGDSESRGPSVESTEIGESGEDECGDDSGEEKISSALFVPHHGPEESTDQELQAAAPGASCKSRSVSRSQDDNPWLVKADELESEESQAPATQITSPEFLSQTDGGFGEDFVSRIGDDFAIVDEPEAAIQQPSAAPSRPASVYYEADLHEHQLAPKQPLPAIELIPYRHQVGGHTTLWRFSKRAVCKQLNNRENEFYETVERLHRDLLPFLPRYIGVLNVTFHKQPRRKSTVRKDDLSSEKKPAAEAGAVPPLPGSLDEPRDRPTTAPKEATNTHQGQDGTRLISQSISATQTHIPTVTFDDNRHIIPRNLLQPNASAFAPSSRSKSATGVLLGKTNGHLKTWAQSRPGLDDRANSWGATTVNKKLRNEVFNDAFLKQPVAVEKHRRPHQRSIPRPGVQHMLKPAHSDTRLLAEASEVSEASDVSRGSRGSRTSKMPAGESSKTAPKAIQAPAQSNGIAPASGETTPSDVPEVKDISGTSAPEPEILGETCVSNKRRRRFSGSGLRRKPPAVSEPRGDLKYFEEADQVGYKDSEISTSFGTPTQTTTPEALDLSGTSPRPMEPIYPGVYPGVVALQPQETTEIKVPRPINPKEAQTQRDKRVEYFLLLEDLTAGMKKPCVMDLKMGTRQYGVDATATKQVSQKGKCAKTTSRELGVRVCGLQVWDARTQTYMFKDKYAGRRLQAGQEFKEALARFLYNGVDYYSVLRHIPTILQKLNKLEGIVRGLKGYRFYAASLLMFYDGDTSPEAPDYDTAIDDSTTDAATDTEEASALRRKKKNKRHIDFKIADFANSITATSDVKDRPCPPQHPDEPDRGFLRGLRNLRKYFLQIQREVREDLGIEPHGRTLAPDDVIEEDDEGLVSE